MARSSDPLAEDEIWGTWEELLLACAVNRHGAHSWDSVASEVRSCSPYANLLTADNCKHRYRLLKRRFTYGGGEADGINDGDDIDGEEPTFEIPWLDELRKLRVAELRRDVQRYDVSIGSLQREVKKLKEERERSFGEPEAGDAVNGSESGWGSDLKEKDDQQEDQIESPRSKPENAAGDRISEDSGRSCKESNSTDPKAEQEVKVDERIKEEADPAVNGSRSESRSDPVGGAEASYNGSSDTIAKGAVRSSAVEQNQALNDSGESVAESRGGEDEEGTKESSDVQSSASLSRRWWRGRWRKSAAADSAEEPEAEASSPARKVVDAESQPLIVFLDTIRSNKDGSVFAHRLESQESVRYRSLIRRHVDLEIVRNRIGHNGYASAEFFRDLLLLCNNALVFYPKNSPESISAIHIRDLINKEIAKTPQASPQSAKEPTPPPTAAPPVQVAPPPPPPSKPKSDPDRANASLEKPALLPPLVACRKRSSILVKPAKHGKKAEKVVKEEKRLREKKEIEEEEDDEYNEDEDEEKDKEKIADKKRMKQRTTVSRGLRTNKRRGNSSKGGGGGGGSAVQKNPKSDPVAPPKPDPAELEAKSGGPSTAKKRSAADFLNRMKSSSPSSNGKLIETLKSPSSSRRGGSSDQPQKKKMKEEGKEENSAAASAGKRSVGRPPKRVAAMPVPLAKRAREEKTPPLPKKRGRR